MTTTRRTAALASLLLAFVVLAGCKPVGLGDPSAVGVVAAVDVSVDTVGLSFVPDPGYEYFSGTIFFLEPGTDVRDSGWDPLDPTEIAAGATIEVWTAECAESFPVQCTVTNVRVVDPGP